MIEKKYPLPHGKPCPRSIDFQPCQFLTAQQYLSEKSLLICLILVLPFLFLSVRTDENFFVRKKGSDSATLFPADASTGWQKSKHTDCLSSGSPLTYPFKLRSNSLFPSTKSFSSIPIGGLQPSAKPTSIALKDFIISFWSHVSIAIPHER